MKWPLHAVQTTWNSPLGPIHLSATAQGLAGLWFHDKRHRPNPAALEQWPLDDAHPLLNEAKRQLQSYFSGERTAFDLPLDLSAGTLFQQTVWHRLLAIPSGDSQTYRQVAGHIQRPKAMRAVGGAVGRNPISIVAPCHRVLGTNGSLTGYAGGLERKIELLKLEGAQF